MKAALLVFWFLPIVSLASTAPDSLLSKLVLEKDPQKIQNIIRLATWENPTPNLDPQATENLLKEAYSCPKNLECFLSFEKKLEGQWRILHMAYEKALLFENEIREGLLKNANQFAELKPHDLDRKLVLARVQAYYASPEFDQNLLPDFWNPIQILKLGHNEENVLLAREWIKSLMKNLGFEAFGNHQSIWKKLWSEENFSVAQDTEWFFILDSIALLAGHQPELSNRDFYSQALCEMEMKTKWSFLRSIGNAGLLLPYREEKSRELNAMWSDFQLKHHVPASISLYQFMRMKEYYAPRTDGSTELWKRNMEKPIISGLTKISTKYTRFMELDEVGYLSYRELNEYDLRQNFYNRLFQKSQALSLAYKNLLLLKRYAVLFWQAPHCL